MKKMNPNKNNKFDTGTSDTRKKSHTHQIVSPKLIFLKRKIKHLQKQIEREKESVLGDAVTVTEIKIFVGIYAILFFIHGAYHQYFPSIMKNIQRQFAFSLRELEFVIGVEKIGFLIFVIFVGYYGNKMHKPVALLFGALFCACGMILCACPYFTNTVSEHPGNITDVVLYYEAGLCQIDSNDTKTTKTQCEALLHNPNSGQAFSFLAGGAFLTGIGSAFLLTLGFIYIEESAQKDKAPLFYGVIIFMNGAGGCLGLVAAWYFAKVPYTLKGSLGEWNIGAWWLALPILATLFLSISLPLLLFPKWIVEPNWLINRRDRQLKRWMNLVKAEEKLLNKIKRRQRRKQRKEENARRKKERDKCRSVLYQPKNIDSSLTASPEQPEDSAEATQTMEVPTHLGNPSRRSQNGMDNSTDPTEANDVILEDEPAQVCIEAEVHVSVSNGNVKQDEEDDNEVSDEETDQEETNNAPSSHDTAQPQSSSTVTAADTIDNSSVDSSQQDTTVRMTDQQDSSLVYSKHLSNATSSHGVHFATDHEGKILTETSTEVEDILQMEEPPQKEVPLEDSEPLSTEKAEKERRRRILGRRIQDLPKNLWFLLNRPVFSLVLAGAVLAAYSPSGYQSTLPTYLSAQMAVHESLSYMQAGLPYSIGLSLSALVSGWVNCKKNWKLMVHIRIIMISQSVATILFLLGMIPSCEINHFFQSSTGVNIRFTHKCSNYCDCREAQYEPICTTDGIVFPNSCLAGCRSVSFGTNKNVAVYSKCMCVPDGEISAVHCKNGCTEVAAGYAVLVFFISACQNFGLVSLIIICLRCISQKLRSLGLAFAMFVIMLAAFVPGIAVFKAFQALHCVYKETDCLGDDICWRYGYKYQYLYHGASSLFQLISFFFFLGSMFVIHSKMKTLKTTVMSAEHENTEISVVAERNNDDHINHSQNGDLHEQHSHL